MSQARIQKLIVPQGALKDDDNDAKQADIKAIEEEMKKESFAITYEVLRESTLHNIKQKIPQHLTQEQEAEFRSNLTRILNEEKVPKALYQWIIDHQLSAIKALLNNFTIYNPKLVTYSEQKMIADKKQYASLDIPEETFLKINLRLAREDNLTRGILKFVEEQQQSRLFEKHARDLMNQTQAPGITFRRG